MSIPANVEAVAKRREANENFGCKQATKRFFQVRTCDIYLLFFTFCAYANAYMHAYTYAHAYMHTCTHKYMHAYINA